MPAFVRTKKDEKRWSRAKAAVEQSRKKNESSFDDQDWALTNHIYHQMHKSEVEDKLEEVKQLAKSSSDITLLDKLLETLSKAGKKKLSDEYDPYDEDDNEDDDENLENQGFREFDPDEESSEADKWLEENDPDKKSPKTTQDNIMPEEQPDEEPQESPDVEPAATSEPSQEAQDTESSSGESQFPQPTKEDIAAMREYTRPWEQRAREAQRLRAEAHANPVLHREGKVVEAHKDAHRARQEAYDKFMNSPEYQNADPVTQMEMDAKFHENWNKENPDYLVNALHSHSKAHEQAKKDAESKFAANKAGQLQHIMRGGVGGGDEPSMSVEEAMQHAGGEKTDEGTTGSIAQDKAAAFANSNQEYLRRLQQHADKHKTEKEFKNKLHAVKDKIAAGQAPEYEDHEFAIQHAPAIRDILRSREVPTKNIEDMESYSPQSQKKLSDILGEHANLNDPSKKKRVDEFFNKYYPLIGMNAKRVMNKLGLDAKRGDVDLDALHEAGVHGLFHAINDYNHENPSKANFATHAGNKIRGLMQTAMRSQDQVPAKLRVGAKKFHQLMGQHPAGADMKDRVKRTDTQRMAQGVKKPEGEGNK